MMDQYQNVGIGVAILVGVLTTGYVAAKSFSSSKLAKARKKWNEAGKDVVVLHMFPRAKEVINLSPFPIKLETFLRINKIKYVTDFEHAMSSKGKSPWITINGVDVADSQLAMDYLSNHFNINMNSYLTKQEIAIARAMRAVLEDHHYFIWIVEKWVIGHGMCMLHQSEIPGGAIGKFLTKLFLERYTKILTKQAYMQGMGRHSLEDVRKMNVQDLDCLANYLGDKPYLMGDKPSEVDCAFFGFMVVIKYAPFTDYDMLENYPNICKYVERMKKEFYPDWNELLKAK